MPNFEMDIRVERQGVTVEARILAADARAATETINRVVSDLLDPAPDKPTGAGS